MTVVGEGWKLVAGAVADAAYSAAGAAYSAADAAGAARAAADAAGAAYAVARAAAYQSMADKLLQLLEDEK